MLCENCKKNEATVFYEENINGKKKSYNLCSKCASEKGIDIPDFGREMLNFGADLFGGMLGNMGMVPNLLIGAVPTHQKRETQKKCPICGSTLADIMKNGKLGCGECYSVFGGMPLPNASNKKEDNQSKKESNEEITGINKEKLEEKLKEAIAAEDFEEAARIRDILRGSDK